MNWEFWGFGLLAVVIALLLSSVELLTRYRSRGFREIFASRHYFLFALLNAGFCFLVYCALPSLSRIVIKTEFATTVDQGLVRAITAGLAYLVIARMSILDITTSEGKTYGAGFDAIYTAFAEFLLDHHRRQMRKRMENDFRAVFQPASPNERGVFTKAANLVYAGLDLQEQPNYKARLDLAAANFPSAVPEYCLTVYLLIRDYTTGPDEARERINDSR